MRKLDAKFSLTIPHHRLKHFLVYDCPCVVDILLHALNPYVTHMFPCVSCHLILCVTFQYAKYMEPHSVDGVRHIFNRACKTHLPKKPNLHMAWGAFEERQGTLQGLTNRGI